MTLIAVHNVMMWLVVTQAPVPKPKKEPMLLPA
jgi:hypothetical protein